MTTKDSLASKDVPKRLLVGHAGLGPFSLSLLAVMLGVVAGFGALGFRALIAVCHNLLFLGRLSAQYDTIQHTPLGRWLSLIHIFTR